MKKGTARERILRAALEVFAHKGYHKEALFLAPAVQAPPSTARMALRDSYLTPPFAAPYT